MKKSMFLLLVAGLFLFLLSTTAYVVREDEVAVVRRLGRVVKVVVDSRDLDILEGNFAQEPYQTIQKTYRKGLRFKLPFADEVSVHSSKYLTYRSSPELLNTRDGRRLEVQMYAQYRIVDPYTFSMTVFSRDQANRRMDELVYKSVIQSANALTFNEFFQENKLQGMLAEQRLRLNRSLVGDFGLYISDIGINRKNFPPSNIDTIEDKMTKQIAKESEKLIAEGDAAYVQAQATTDRQREEILAKAVAEAAIVKAGADAEAMEIYQLSLSKDLEFYRFMQRMKIYREMRDNTVFMDSSNGIFDYFQGVNP
ncbi:SPFH domain-containing protein [Anaerotalea alkaliphila]|uniref:Protein HflC n=1 Tax=Anaerotalea alkaliphila TaxID=2662126 RepID=A0A7X5HUJ7_9FIRM|nr:SPFH domain-containing protein [Anaerotalea alkaliphila]NDL66922.1 hypothetical protein [Anaerotalea alkaliphila]